MKTDKIEIDFLGGGKQAKFTNQLMKAAGMFEDGKQFAIHDRFIITGNPDLSKLCEKVANAYEQVGGYAVFVGIRTVNGKRATESHAWFMPGVQSITMKQDNSPLGFALFKDILQQLGYTAKTDEYMRVIEIE